MCSLRWQI
uniref:Uncharacterized protein n=1 Tax=Arundo donax TaxID=35708 RepID=A0A0A9A362_ARUDO